MSEERIVPGAEEFASTASRDQGHLDQHFPGAAGRGRRPVDHGRAAPGVRTLVLHRADADGLHRAHARACLHCRDRTRTVTDSSGAAVATLYPARLHRLSLAGGGGKSAAVHCRSRGARGLDRVRRTRHARAHRFDWIGVVSLALRLRLYRGPLRAADLRDRDAADRRHRRQRDPDLAGAGRQPAHLGLGLRRHHPGDGGLCLYQPAPAGRFRRPATSRRSG